MQTEIHGRCHNAEKARRVTEEMYRRVAASIVDEGIRLSELQPGAELRAMRRKRRAPRWRG